MNNNNNMYNNYNNSYNNNGAPQQGGFDPWAQPPQPPQRGRGGGLFSPHNMALVSFILGILSLVLAWVYGSGVVTSIIGIVLADKAKKGGETDGFVKAGMTLSIIALCISTLLLVGEVACGGCLGCLALGLL